MKRWWLVAENQDVDLCLEDPGHEVDISLFTDLLSLTQIYIGDLSLEQARSRGKVQLDGPSLLLRGMCNWFARSRFAPVNPNGPAEKSGDATNRQTAPREVVRPTPLIPDSRKYGR